jgi:hypothetical protein
MARRIVSSRGRPAATVVSMGKVSHTSVWPRRNAVCIDCRTALAEGESCAPHHRVRSLHDPLEREELMEEVWGTPWMRQRALEATRVGVGAGTLSVLLKGCEACGGGLACGLDDVCGLVVLAVTVLACIVLGSLIGLLVQWHSRRSARLEPKAARADPPSLGPPTGATGVVRAVALARPPFGSERCVGFSVTFLLRGWLRRSQVMLRDAVTVGFEVALDSGEMVRIPPGRLCVEGATRGAQPCRVEALERYLCQLDPERGAINDLEPFPRDEVRQLLIRHGDRVEVLGPLERRVAPSGWDGSYREPAACTLSPAGPARVRILPAPANQR